MGLPSWGDFTLRPYATQALDIVRPLLPEDELRNGIYLGVFALVDCSYDCPGNLFELESYWVYGENNDSQKRRAKMWMWEKALRLAYHIKYDCWAATSAFEARYDREKGRKGGAIRLQCRIKDTHQTDWDVILSMAGTHERADEAIGLTLAKIAPWELKHPTHLDRIAVISDNPYYKQLQAA